MNRFRAKKKGKDEDGAPRPSHDSESSMPFLAFIKGKKSQEEEKKPIDLATVLPSDDKFRTSLLMTGLSARFSMLREQDDPNTKIGKASDDSVLFPKRQSRMDMASFRGLGDIAEGETMKVASPFSRIESYHSDDADSFNSGSIMTRAKPTEGNNLFGGRQKVYKIAASTGPSKTTDGGMSGRTVYDHDLGQSAFQRWRQAEKEREQLRDGPEDSDTPGEQRNSSADLDPPRSESPSIENYDQKRETSSTLSSIPSIARQSSAATSVTSSQPAASVKDWQPSNPVSTGPDRSVTRTRRLYETGFLSQDNQESANSNTSRVETTGRQRLFGSKLPDFSAIGSGNRLSGERKLLAKASAPNLRSMSSPVSAPPVTVPNLGIHVPNAGESRPGFPVSPPLSPPISEAEENALLSINPNDRGKATSLAVSQKPAQPYDETRYTQRQLQLQRGHETPTPKIGDDANTLASGSQPSSPLQIKKRLADSPTVPESAAAQSTVKDGVQPAACETDLDRGEISSIVEPVSLPSLVHALRPSDTEHPAFRNSALPTPLSIGVKPSIEPPTIAETPSSPTAESKAASALDSPTLGPGMEGSGLSGMVRQHLRGGSNASSIFGGAPPVATRESRIPTESSSIKSPLEDSNRWGADDRGRDWHLDLDVNEPLPDADLLPLNVGKSAEPKVNPRSGDSEGRDEFADRLADEARRIREKLTSFAETDSRSPSPHRMPEQKDVASLPRPSGLGSILRPKSSKSSLTDRGRDPSSTKAFKMMGITPAGSRTNSPGSDLPRGRIDTGAEFGQERDKIGSPRTDDPHHGPRAFQQARGEFPRIKDAEMQSRYYPPPPGPPPDVPSPKQRAARQSGASRTRTPSRDRKTTFFYSQRMPSEELRNGDSPVSSQGTFFNERQRNETDPRIPRQPMRQPPTPGTERSHMMPQQSHPSSVSRMNLVNPNANANGRPYAPYGYESGLTSPIPLGASPLAKPNGQDPGYDNSLGSTSSSQAAMRPRMNSRGVHEVPYPIPTARTPTASSPPDANNHLRSNGRMAPPLPPLNPRRRQDSTSMRTGPESLARHGRESIDHNIPSDRLIHGERRGTITNGDEHTPSPEMRRPSRAMADVANMNMNLSKQRGSSPPIRAVPPMSRIFTAQGRNPADHTDLPGGMI